MASPFLDSFNSALPDLEASFTEDWSFQGTTYPAIAIDHEVDSSKQMKGGEIDLGDVTIFVRMEVFLSAGLQEGDIVTARGRDFAVMAIDKDGDAAVALVCGSAQIDVWGR
jgi:hypothetical protein